MSPIPLGILAASGTGLSSAYELISSQTLSSAATSVTFSSIPSTYKHLEVIAMLKTTNVSSRDAYVTFNSDATSGHYYWHGVRNTGSTVSSQYSVTGAGIVVTDAIATNAVAGEFHVFKMTITDYLGTAKFKTAKIICGNYGDRTMLRFVGGTWASLTALNSIDIKCDTAYSFATNSSFALYGIRG